MIVVTGAAGQLGRLVIAELLHKLPPSEIVAAVRNPAKAQDLAARRVDVRLADYDKPDTLASAFKGAERVVMISTSEVGNRVPQHHAVIDAAKGAGAKLVAYTSILRADTSPLGLGREHRETEALLRASGVPFVLLRNSWYTENYAMSVPAAVQHGVVLGCAGDGRISAASCADYAAAAATVITAKDNQAGRVYELAGDTAFTMTELAAEIERQAGKPVRYQNLPEADYRQALVGVGLPEPVAAMLAESDTGISKGGLFDDGRQLSRLIGRPTTPMPAVVAAALRG
jgi:NAD(P)H dehydrogenase (quinone)